MMNSQVLEFFRVEGDEPHFYQVRFLQNEPDAKREELIEFGVPRGWFELSRVSCSDRVEFLYDFWMSILPYHPTATEIIRDFFSRLDDIGIVLCRQSKEEPFRCELIYSLKDNSSFFRGLPPAPEELMQQTWKELGQEFPRDFQSFLHLHNGFGKLTELGLLPIEEIAEEKRKLVEMIVRHDKPLRSGEALIDPHYLYPFYEDYGGGCQCFSAEWYPGSEMGNVYFSGIDYIVSDTSEQAKWAEQMAYSSFLEWLGGFLSGMSRAL